jgi:hypothetical protein
MHGNDPLFWIPRVLRRPGPGHRYRQYCELGGQVEAPTEEPGFGRFCFCKDPSGLKFGLLLLRSDH